MSSKIFNQAGRVAYRLANTGLVLIALIFSSKFLPKNDYSLLVLISGFSTIAIALLDIYPYKYLISRFSSRMKGGLIKLTINKIIWFVCFCTIIFFILTRYYELSAVLALLILLYCFFSIINITFSSYFFSKVELSHILLLPPVLFCFALSIILKKINIFSIEKVILILMLYRVIEFLCYSLKCVLIHDKRSKKSNHPVVFFEGKYFYLQNLISMSSGNLIAILAPLYLSSESISLYGNVNILMSVVIFYAVFFSSTYYSDNIAQATLKSRYDFLFIIKSYLVKSSIGTFPISILVSLFGIYFYNIGLPELLFIMTYSITIMFTSIQAFLLFKFGVQKFIVVISIATLLVNFTLLLFLLPIFDYYGFFMSSIIVQIFSVTFCFYKINNELDIK